MNLQEVYHLIRKFLFEVILFLFIQSLLLITLAVIVVLYPYTLNILVAVAFFSMALVGLYIMIRVGMIYHQVKVVKKKITRK